MTSGSARHRGPRPAPASGRVQRTQLLLFAISTGACVALAWSAGMAPPPAPAPAPAAVVIAAAAPRPAVEASVPVRIDIASIGVSADVEALGRNGDGTLGTPQKWADAGWYSQGVTPGEPGPAVVVGHRDSAAEGAAVFFRLGELALGDVVTVTESDGNTSNFAVQSLERVAKADFPTERVYAPSEHRLLKLITCTGDFDFDARSYLENLVVTARAV